MSKIEESHPYIDSYFQRTNPAEAQRIYVKSVEYNSDKKPRKVSKTNMNGQDPFFHLTKTDVTMISSGSDVSRRFGMLNKDANLTVAAVPSEIHDDMKKSCLLAFYVLPALSAFYWAFIIPYRIKIDPESQKYVLISGSTVRKVICCVMDLAVVIYYLAKLMSRVKQTNGGAIGVIYHITYLIFILSACGTLYVVWLKIDKILALFVAIDALQSRFRCVGMPFHGSNTMRILKYLLFVFHALIIVAHVIFIAGEVRIYRTLVSQGLNLQSLYQMAENTTQDFLENSSLVLFGFDSYMNNKTSMAQLLVILVAVAFEIVEFVSTCGWVLANLLIMMWGFLFRKLLLSFYVKAETNGFLGGSILDDIRDFNTVTGMLNRFNDIFGIINFFTVIAAILYISVFSGYLFISSALKGNTLFPIVYLMSDLPFVFFLIIASEVNRLAGDFPTFLKRRLSIHHGLIWSQHNGQNLEVLQGLAIVHNDVQTNAVGFQGMGFFTISYSFIGTVISVIASYAIVTLQLKSTPTSPTTI